MKKTKLLLLFDLDGVLIDSLPNMKYSWNEVKKKYKIKKSFSVYRKFIGIPFQDILKKININKNCISIERTYGFYSENNINKIKLYKGVKEVLKYLKKKNYTLGIVTSKNSRRTILITKKLKIFSYFDLICSPRKGLKGKPNPDQIIYAYKKLKFLKEECLYIGDTKFDLLAANRARVPFLHCRYGYGKKIKNQKYINNPIQLKNFLKKNSVL